MMEDLNKKQIILLVILVTFVISMSTSIITYSLLSEAPSTITQTVNRVVERTIEKVVPNGETIERTKEIKEISVVIQEDAVLDAVSGVIGSIGILKRAEPYSPEEILGPGVLLENGLIIALKNEEIVAGNYIFEISGKKLPITLKSVKTTFPIFVLKEERTELKGLKIAGGSLSLGQTAIYIGGQYADKVLIGRISQLIKNDEQVVSEADIDIVIKDTANRGVIIDLSGAIIGIKPTGEKTTFITSAILNKDIAGLAVPAP